RELEAICPSRKPWVDALSFERLVSANESRVARTAAPPQMIGASTAGTTTFARIPLQITPLVPTAASTEPTTPPINACDDDDGMPKYHVRTFQRIAPTSPANTIGTVTMSCSTIPLAIVAATEIERNAPAKFNADARPTAIRGGSARVAIVVAIALAVS